MELIMIAKLTCLCLILISADDWKVGGEVKLADANALRIGSSELKCAIALDGGGRITVGESLRLRIEFDFSGGSPATLFNPLFDHRTTLPGTIVAVNAEGKYVRNLLATSRSTTQQIPKSAHWIELPPNSKLERVVTLFPSKEPTELSDLGSALAVGKYRAQLVCNDKLTSFRLPETTHKDFPLAQRLFDGPITNCDVIRSNVIEFEIVAK